MFENYTKGQLAVLRVQQRALELGWDVCIPTVEARYDLVLVDTDGKCHKVQVKYADHKPTQSAGSIFVDFRKQTRNNGKTKLYTEKEIDALVAYLPAVDKIVWLNKDIFSEKNGVNIRFEPSKNGQKSGIRMYYDFVW